MCIYDMRVIRAAGAISCRPDRGGGPVRSPIEVQDLPPIIAALKDGKSQGTLAGQRSIAYVLTAYNFTNEARMKLHSLSSRRSDDDEKSTAPCVIN